MRRARRYLPLGLLVTGEMVTGRDPDWRMVLAPNLAPNRRVLIHRWCNPWPSDCRLSMFVAPWIPHQDFWHPLVKSFGQNMFVLSTFFCCCPVWCFLALFWSQIIFSSLPFWIVLFNLQFRTTNKEHRLNPQPFFRLSQPFSLAHPNIFRHRNTPTSRTPGPSGPTLRRWRPNLTRKSWGVPAINQAFGDGWESPTNIVTGDGLWHLWFMNTYDMGKIWGVPHKSTIKAYESHEESGIGCVFFFGYLFPREMVISSAKVEIIITMKHRDFTSKTLTRREKWWKRRCVARGLAVAYTVPQNSLKELEGTFKFCTLLTHVFYRIAFWKVPQWKIHWFYPTLQGMGFCQRMHSLEEAPRWVKGEIPPGFFSGWTLGDWLITVITLWLFNIAMENGP